MDYGLSRDLAGYIDSLDEALKAEELSEYAAQREVLLESVEQLCRPTKPTAFTTMFKTYDILRTFPVKLPAKVMKHKLLSNC